MNWQNRLPEWKQKQRWVRRLCSKPWPRRNAKCKIAKATTDQGIFENNKLSSKTFLMLKIVVLLLSTSRQPIGNDWTLSLMKIGFALWICLNFKPIWNFPFPISPIQNFTPWNYLFSSKKNKVHQKYQNFIRGDPYKPSRVATLTTLTTWPPDHLTTWTTLTSLITGAHLDHLTFWPNWAERLATNKKIQKWIVIFEGSRHPNFLNPFEYGQSFIGKSFSKRIGTLTTPNPEILRGGTMCPPPHIYICSNRLV